MLMAAGNGETLNIGRDLDVPVTDYVTPQGRIEHDIPHASYDFDLNLRGGRTALALQAARPPLTLPPAPATDRR